MVCVKPGMSTLCSQEKLERAITMRTILEDLTLAATSFAKICCQGTFPDERRIELLLEVDEVVSFPPLPRASSRPPPSDPPANSRSKRSICQLHWFKRNQSQWVLPSRRSLEQQFRLGIIAVAIGQGIPYVSIARGPWTTVSRCRWNWRKLTALAPSDQRL